MKHTKQLLALLLAVLALLFSLSVSAAAELNLDDFYIKKQPEAITVPFNESFTLSVEVNIPDEVDEVRYQWHRYYASIPDATTDELSLSPDSDNFSYPYGSEFSDRTQTYYCVITAYIEDEPVKELPTDHVVVTVQGRAMTFAERAQRYLAAITGGPLTVMGAIVGFPILLGGFENPLFFLLTPIAVVIAPIAGIAAFLFYLIAGFFTFFIFN
ncbi:MAG: hypothetical protein FWH26_07265 [Oscillospiraceae bacterium]|nr:hypothetical protein [Oscillospiraceae bacterium]